MINYKLMDTDSITIVDFGRSTKNVCICVSFAIILIIIFMMTPISKLIYSSMFGRFIILIILGYALYSNMLQTTKFSYRFDISLISGDWDHKKTNVVCSWVFSLFIFILFYTILKTFF